MAYEVVTGTIETIGRTGKQVLLDDGEWYGAFDKKQLKGAQAGDTIEFDMEVNDKGDKTFFNIKGDVKFVGEEREEEEQTPRGRSNARSSGRAPARSAPERAPARSSAPARGESRGAPTRGGRGAQSSGGGNDQRQTSIIRQNSLTQANALIGHSDALKADLQELSGEDAVAFVIDIARGFEAYSQAND